MGAGKVLSIIGGILTLAGFFFLNWLDISLAAIETAMTMPAGSLGTLGIAEPTVVYGLAGILKIMWMIGGDLANIFAQFAANGGPTLPSYIPYIFVAVVVLMALSGIFQLIGAKSKAMAITGSLLPLLFCVFIILLIMAVLPLPAEATPMIQLFIVLLYGGTTSFPGVAALPFSYNLMGIGLGIWVMAVGSLLAFISGFMSREDF